MYSIKLKSSAEKELDALPDIIHNRIVEVILRLEQKPRPVGVKKLKGREGYRMRIGDYRLLYEVDDKAKTVWIVSVGHRKEIYR